MAAREGSDESPAHTYQCPQCCRRATKWNCAYRRKGLHMLSELSYLRSEILFLTINESSCDKNVHGAEKL